MPNVLVVDDAPDVRLLVATVLAEAGYTVTLAAGGQEALQILERGPQLDAVVLDVQMPDVDGWTVLQHLQLESDPPPVVLCTVKAGVADRERAWSLGVEAYVTKPFVLDELKATLGAVVRARTSVRAL